MGIDLDNTLVDTTTAYLLVYNHVSRQAETVADVDDFCQLWRIYGWREDQSRELNARHGHDIHPRPMPEALAVCARGTANTRCR